MMQYASEDLVAEHEGILSGLNILEKMVHHLEEGEPVDRKDLLGILDFLRLFADKCHHGKEEGLLFPELENRGMARENSPIGQLLIEHVEGRKFLAMMGEALKKEDFGSFSENATAYIALLRSHIKKENEILFPLGDQLIAPNRHLELLDLFEAHELNVMGAGTHEKLHHMLHKFQEKYSMDAKPPHHT